jgi:cytochrome c oxidase assembly protein subunit 11
MSLSPLSRARALVADNRRMVGKLVAVTVLMFGFGYALVPIYRTICEALGVNVLARAEVQSGEAVGAVGNSQVDLSRTVTIEFDANSRGPWDFKPAQAKVDVHPGEVTTVMYEFRNRQNRPWRRRRSRATRPTSRWRTSRSSSASASPSMC